MYAFTLRLLNPGNVATRACQHHFNFFHYFLFLSTAPAYASHTDLKQSQSC
jgi:hypothetical protein